MRKSNIIISSTDHSQLQRLVNSARLNWRVPRQSLDMLEGELARATIVDPEDLPRDVIAMNSMVWFRDLDTEEIDRYQLVFPPALVGLDQISVLAPIGTALLGYRLHDVVEWEVPKGRRRLEITKVEQQHSIQAAELVALSA
jgi:regulator of nucleoside diphosphate kinase